MTDGYYDNRGNWVDPKPKPSRFNLGQILMVVIINSLAMVIAEKLVGGLHFADFGSVVFAALLFAVVNWSIKPFIQLISLPFTILTFGLFALIVNGLMLELVAFFIKGFTIAGFGSAILGSIVITLCNMIINAILPKS